MDDFGQFLQDKALKFSVRIVNLFKHLKYDKKEFDMSEQLLRSGTSIGANLAEAKNAISDADILSKMYISLKESSESQYWIELLHQTDYLNDSEYVSIKTDCDEIVKILTSSIKKLNAKKEL